MSTQPTVTPQDDSQAPNVPMTSAPPSTLGAVVSGSGSNPVMPRYDNSDERQTDADTAVPYTPGNRLASVLSTIGKAMATGLSAIPDTGAPSFVTGLGQGARAEQAAQQQDQVIKFKDFDSQVRLAQLHNQDLELQMHTQAQSDAHQAAQDAQHDWDEAHGLQYDEIPNSGPAVTDHLTAQTAANGAASVPAGTHLSADGKTILVPRQSDDTQKAQLAKYNAFRVAYGLPQLPQGAQFVPSKLVDMMQNRIEGHSISGDVYNHDTLPVAIADLQSNRDAYAKSDDADATVLKAVDGTIGSMKAKLQYLDNHKASVLQQNASATAQGKADVANNAANQAAAAKGAGMKAAAVAANKPQKAADNTELNAVAFDPNFQNPDGSKGANVVMSKADAAAKGLTHYKVDVSGVNSLVGSMNDVQGKLNQLADVVNDPNKFGQVQPGAAAALIHHDEGFSASFGAHGGGGSGGVGVPLSRFNEWNYNAAVKDANQATRDYVTAFLGAHEAITQLPRLQTFGKSSRMTQQQMEAAVNLLPQPGDAGMATQKMSSLQTMIDPLRKQIPRMPGAEQIPSWREKQQTQQTPSRLNSAQSSNLAQFVSGLR